MSVIPSLLYRRKSSFTNPKRQVFHYFKKLFSSVLSLETLLKKKLKTKKDDTTVPRIIYTEVCTQGGGYLSRKEGTNRTETFVIAFV